MAVMVVNLFEVLDPQDVFRPHYGRETGRLLQRPPRARMDFGAAQELRILQVLIRLSHKSLVSQLRRHAAEPT